MTNEWPFNPRADNPGSATVTKCHNYIKIKIAVSFCAHFYRLLAFIRCLNVYGAI